MLIPKLRNQFAIETYDKEENNGIKTGHIQSRVKRRRFRNSNKDSRRD